MIREHLDQLISELGEHMEKTERLRGELRKHVARAEQQLLERVGREAELRNQIEDHEANLRADGHVVAPHAPHVDAGQPAAAIEAATAVKGSTAFKPDSSRMGPEKGPSPGPKPSRP
ncbi:MAG: hypothetical protein JO130_18500 [Solirubrobacterales bacterium]|nr:hypothetical protein [Solirubrobacterales bacterium]